MSSEASAQRNSRAGLMTVAWLWVGLPFAYGVVELIINVAKIFKAT